MSETKPAAAAPMLSTGHAAVILNHEARWIALRTLARSEPLPVYVLAEKAGLRRAAMSKHMLVLLRYGVVAKGYGGLYTIAPAYRPGPDAEAIDFGTCTIRIDPQSEDGAKKKA